MQNFNYRIYKVHPYYSREIDGISIPQHKKNRLTCPSLCQWLDQEGLPT